MLGLKLDFSYPLISRFSSLARNKDMSYFKEIYKKGSTMHTHAENHIDPKLSIYKFGYWPKTAITFGEEWRCKLSLAYKFLLKALRHLHPVFVRK